MRRRQVLRRTALLGTLGLAGCTGGSGPGADDGTTEPDSSPAEPTDTETATETKRETATRNSTGTGTRTSTDERGTDTPEQTDRPAMPDGVTDSTFEVTDSTGGEQTDSATVAFDADANTVTVTGTIWGSDACQTAELAGLDLTDGELTVGVREVTEPGSEGRACAQVIVKVDYEATVTLEALPETVVVTHDHGDGPTEVASTSR